MEKREWKTIKEYQDILFDFYNGIAKITINRPRYRNAFTPTTTSEISDALLICRECQDINVVVLTGAGDKAFCSGEDISEQTVCHASTCLTYRSRYVPFLNL